MRLSKEEAITRVHRCAKQYDKNLLGNNILFLTSCNGIINYFEVACYAKNFKHLTGLLSSMKATQFFSAALNNKLSKEDITFSEKGTTELKMNILNKVMSIHLIARMIGDYDNSQIHLAADKLAGTTTAVMGFKESGRYYVPSTVLKEDVRNLTFDPQQKVIATFIKSQKVKLYTELSYITKDIKVFTDNTFDDIGDKIDFLNLHASFPQRDATDEDAQKYVDNAVIMFGQNKGRNLYISKDGSSVLVNYTGVLVTVIPKENFEPHTKYILGHILKVEEFL